MQPGARLSAAIEILDEYLSGTPIEQAIKVWSRGARYAGSKDRFAVRDIVYQCLRCRLSYAWITGRDTGRGLVLGMAMDESWDVDGLFDGNRHNPSKLQEHERSVRPLADAPEHIQADCPDWLWPYLQDYGDERAAILSALRARADTFLRTNLLKCDRDNAIDKLATDGIEACPHPLANTAIRVLAGARSIRNSSTFLGGYVELQDAASQATIEFADPKPGASVLDLCAGGGGKSLAVAALTGTTVTAHDENARRMSGLKERAQRADAEIEIIEKHGLKNRTFDMVVCDVPCSGSGSWRRDPEGKWKLTASKLLELVDTQQQILTDARSFVGPGGSLVYITCSLLTIENNQQIQKFLDDNQGWSASRMRQFLPSDGGDGFFVTILTAV